jgi:hypothetical protein
MLVSKADCCSIAVVCYKSYHCTVVISLLAIAQFKQCPRARHSCAKSLAPKQLSKTNTTYGRLKCFEAAAGSLSTAVIEGDTVKLMIAQNYCNI